MDALYPRLLVDDFAATVEFYRGALEELFGIQPVKVIPEATYANWDLGGEAALVLFGRAGLAAALGLDAEAPPSTSTMLVLKVDDVDAAAQVVEKHGATPVAEAQDRPQWGPNLRTAHLRAPDGTLLELQSY
ncbi:VOC family protein [Kribbella italica]|uniref:Putative enzyme related to lactoylglutathione lyase n=1 Tax=Kribbella italica TaxID=1540520 RepID=A0A7W9MYG1_9ACTN|nr:VOC family protein [Kribbella italica]MBB5840123.1 putative enzyme related to lactoylglutathione lyase [Kribbella italica]